MQALDSIVTLADKNSVPLAFVNVSPILIKGWPQYFIAEMIFRLWDDVVYTSPVPIGPTADVSQ